MADANSAPEVATRKARHGAAILSLVDQEYLKSTANTSKSMWEPMSYLYSEADKAMARVEAMHIPGCKGTDSCKEDKTHRAHEEQCLEWARQATISRWHQVLGWLDDLLVQSQSVGALRSWQLMTGLQAAPIGQQRPSGAIMPDFPQPQAPGTEKPRRRMMGG